MTASVLYRTSLAILLALVLVPVVPTLGQQWVKDMFEEKEHDFGAVPRGAKASYQFKFVNKYEETLHISRVTSSCNCTTPRVEKADLKTYEEGSIICDFNTTSFVGPKMATVTVYFDQPFQGEMQLTVKGNIRSEISTDPGIVDFGPLDVGTSKEAVVKVQYTGSMPWEITDVRSENKHLGVRLTKLNGTLPKYEMNVVLKETAPAGTFNDQIVLVTNESQFNLVTIPVRGEVTPPLVMPVSVELGTIKVGKVHSTIIFVKSKQEFAITDIECEDERFKFKIPEGAKRVHSIPVEFAAGDTAGGFRHRIKVKTNLESDNEASTLVSGNVVD